MKARNKKAATQRARHVQLAVYGLSLMLGACASDVSELGDADSVEVGKQEQAMVSEIFGGVAERAYFRYFLDPVATLRSYAAVTTTSVGGVFNGTQCSGIMIGPNVMISAGHCHGDAKTATFRAYVTGSQQSTENFNCDPLVQTWPENDLTMHWCYPNADGVNPGDRWGYVDLDIDVTPAGQFNYTKSRERVAKDAQVYAVWSNSLTSLDTRQHHLYSQGKITDTNLTSWFNPGGDPCLASDDLNLGVKSDAWSRSGASGSSTLSLGTDRLLLAPLSSASNAANGAAGRWSSAIADLIWHGKLWDARQSPQDAPAACNGRLEPQVNLATLTTLWNQDIRFGSSLADYTKYIGWLDDDNDGIFDIHHDLELSAGERQREIYDLGFESHRRNALWTRANGTQIDIDMAKTTMGASGAPDMWHDLLEHSTLHLDPGKTYRISYRVYATTDAYVSACTTFANCTVNFVPGSQSTIVVDELPGEETLRFSVWSDAQVSLSEVTVTDVEALLDFDTADQRSVWRKPGLPFSTAATILPNGTASATKADWAGIVRKDTALIPFKYTLSSDRIGLPQGSVRVCFDYKRIDTSGITPKAFMHIANTAGSDLNFTPTTTWKRSCSPFATTTKAGNAVEFGAEGSTFSYAVDNIVIEGP